MPRFVGVVSMRKVLTILCLAVLLSGCTALMVGNGSGGRLGQGERTEAQIRQDGVTTAAVSSRLASDTRVGAFNIGVETFANRVTLRGTVDSYEVRMRAQELADSVDDVVSVSNQIRVVTQQ